MISKASAQKTIETMTKRIVRKFHPEKIILFGSHARGDAGQDSDVDLLVVMPIEGSKHEVQRSLRMALGDIRIAFDVIVTRPEDFEWRKKYPGTIERPAYLQGKVLYDRG